MDDLRDRLDRARRLADPPQDAFERLEALRGRKAARKRVITAALALMLAAGVVGGALVALGGLGGTGAPGNAPKQVGLGAGGSGQNNGPSLVAGPGQFYYWQFVRVIPDQPPSQAYTYGLKGGYAHEQMWWGQDGSGRYEANSETSGYAVRPSGPFDKGNFPGIGGFETDVSGLSSDPAVLGQELLVRSGSEGASPEPQVTLAPGVSQDTSNLWRSAQRLFEQGTAEPKMRVALFEVLAAQPEVREQTGVADPVGRPAISLSLDLGGYYGGGSDVFYFDPDTHLLMAWQDGQLGETLIVSEGGIVNSRSDTPSAGGTFFPPPQEPLPSP